VCLIRKKASLGYLMTVKIQEFDAEKRRKKQTNKMLLYFLICRLFKKAGTITQHSKASG